MANIAIFRINYKSDFILTLQSDAGWMTPFCIKFWTGAPSQAYFAGWDGTTYTHCAPVEGAPTKLSVQFDDHHLPIGDLKFQIGYHFSVADFPTSIEDEVINQAAVIIDNDGEQQQVMLDFNGETAPEIQFSLPAYANEAQRIANEQARIAAEEQRIANEQARISAEETRQANEQQRISQEEARVSEFARLKTESEAATDAATSAANTANASAQNADEKAALAQSAATLANQKAQLAADKATLAQAAATLANAKAQLAADKAALAQQKADYAQTQGDYAKAQGDYAKTEAEAAHSLNEEVSHDEATRQQQEAARQAAEAQRVTDFNAQMQQQQTAFQQAEAERETAYEQAEASRNASFQQAESARTTDFNNQLQLQQTAYTDAEAARETAFDEAEQQRDAKVDEKVADITNLQTKVADLENVVADLEVIAEGYVRVAGSSSPALSYKSYKYHEQGGFGRESAFSLFYPCLVGTKLTGGDEQVGKILHILQKLDYGHDIYGVPRKIDGTEGDVMIVNVEPYYRIIGKHTIQGTDYDVFLMSRSPFEWQGIEAEHVARFGWAPDFCVSHVDEDGVTRMHSVFNPDWNGSYWAPQGMTGKYVYTTDEETGEMVETFDGDATVMGGAGGLHTTNKALYVGEQEAMNQNPDTTKTVPYMNATAAGVENMFAAMLAEGGTFDAHNADLMGSGYCANDPATNEADWSESASGAKNGMRVMDKDGNWKYYGFSSRFKFLTGGFLYPAQALNNYTNPFHIMEAHRAMSYAIKNGVHELEWFAFEGNKYKWRSVEGFAGPAQGEMTCVVWKYIATQCGANAVDPTDNTTSIAGNRLEFLVSIALFHGMTTQVSPSWWTSGLVFVKYNNGDQAAYMERDQESLTITPNGNKPETENWPFEDTYTYVDTYGHVRGYRKDYNNKALMLPSSLATETGGGLHTYVCAYNYFDGSKPAAGIKSSRGCLRGHNAYDTNLSPLCVGGNVAPSGSYTNLGFGTCCRIVD